MSVATLSARIARLEQRQESSAGVGFSIEWWKWKTARKRGESYTPDLPPGMTIEELDARQRERERAYLATPEGAEWERKKTATLAEIASWPDDLGMGA